MSDLDLRDHFSEMNCDDCGGPLFCAEGPKDGWQLEDGRSVCNDCSVADLKRIATEVKEIAGGRVVH